MKRIFTLCFALLAGLAVFAQGNTVEFVDAGGNVIPAGSTVVRDNIEFSSITGIGTIHSGVYVKNMTTSSTSCAVSCSIENMPSGQFQICGFGNCVPVPLNDRIAEYPISDVIDCDAVPLAAGETMDTQSEWMRVRTGNYGSFNVKYSIQGGSEITVNYVYSDPTGINDVQTSTDKTVVGYYTLGGQQLDCQQKGINIIKYSDGTTEKKLLR